MRFRTTIILVLLLLGLGAYVYWVEYPNAQQEAKKKTLVDFTADDATEVSLVYADREIALKKTGDEWRLTKPLEALADSTTVKNLVNAIAECEVKKELTEAAADLSQYGLDKPLVTVTVKMKNKALPAIVVGKNTPVGASTYVQRADDKKVVLTNSAFRSGMDKTVKDLRDKTILAFTDDDLQKLQISTPDTTTELVRKEGTWRIERPEAWPADAVAVRSFLSTLRSMRATDFPADAPTDLAAYGLDNPRLRIVLTIGKENLEKQVLLGKQGEKNELYVQASGQPTVYTVSDWVFRDLNKTAGDFRDKTLLAFDRDKIGAVEVQRQDGASFKLVRGDNKAWRVDGNDGQPNESAITQFLSELHELKGYEVLADHPSDLAQFGLDHPLLTLTVFGEDKQQAGAVLLAPRPGGEGKKEYTGMAEGGPSVFLVRDYVIPRLNKQAQDFIQQATPTAGAGVPAAPAAPPAAQVAPEPDDEAVGDEPLGAGEPDQD
jgi:hypothetical protein